MAERSKAIVSGTILFEVAGSNPASCILGSVEYEKKTEIRKETQCNVGYKQQNGLLTWFFYVSLIMTFSSSIGHFICCALSSDRNV